MGRVKIIPLRTILEVKQSANNKCDFELKIQISQKYSYSMTLGAEKAEDCQQWIQAIQQAIDNYLKQGDRVHIMEDGGRAAFGRITGERKDDCYPVDVEGLVGTIRYWPRSQLEKVR